MDYLDPKKKKLKRTRILIGYALMGAAISIATVVMVYLANGYYIDRETGTVIQNGLIYLDSKPESAEVFLNGEKQRGSTDARLVVPEGPYDIELTREGYRTWSRSVQLEGGNLRQLTYARLIPTTLESEPALELPSAPLMQSQSNDKRWLVMSLDNSPLRLQFVDLQQDQLVLSTLPLPLDLLSSTEPGVWNVLEWASDNATFLATYTTPSSVEYVMINRADPTQSVNVQTALPDTTFTGVTMRDRKNDLVFTHDRATGTVLRADLTSGETTPYLTDVIDYVDFGDDTAVYVTSVDASEGTVRAIIKRGLEELFLREIQEDDTYLLDIARLGNALVVGVGSPTENRVIVYNDPFNALEQNDFSTTPVATTVLRIENPQELSISADASVIMARNGSRVGTHEFEADRTYLYTLEHTIDADKKVVWLDGQHMTFSASGVQYIADFDGSNVYELVASLPALGSVFSSSLDFMYTFNAEVAGLSQPTMTRTFMRTSADR